MKRKHLLEDPAIVKSLAERLSACNAVTRFDRGESREAWTLAHAFADLEESFRKILEDQLPKLLQQLPDSNTEETLLEIGEEFRHILYHIADSEFYRYLRDGRPGAS
jgi:hypothetical protein